MQRTSRDRVRDYQWWWGTQWKGVLCQMDEYPRLAWKNRLQVAKCVHGYLMHECIWHCRVYTLAHSATGEREYWIDLCRYECLGVFWCAKERIHDGICMDHPTAITIFTFFKTDIGIIDGAEKSRYKVRCMSVTILSVNEWHVIRCAHAAVVVFVIILHHYHSRHPIHRTIGKTQALETRRSIFLSCARAFVVVALPCLCLL
jgi:hypothetical protein